MSVFVRDCLISATVSFDYNLNISPNRQLGHPFRTDFCMKEGVARENLLRVVKTTDTCVSVWAFVFFIGGPSKRLSSHCDCCCKSHKSDREGESGTSFNELSTSCSETQSEASSPQGTVICGPVSRRPNIQTLDRPLPKGPAHMLQQAEMRRKTDLLRVRTFGVREREAAKRKANKEKMTPEQELEKCIQDFRRIRIPDRFPERKYMWQSELLRKYRL